MVRANSHSQSSTQGWMAGDSPFNHTLPELPQAQSPDDLNQLLRDHPDEAYRVAQRILTQNSLSLSHFATFLKHPFSSQSSSNATRGAAQSLAFVQQSIRQLRLQHRDEDANRLQTKLEEAQACEELFSTLGQGSFLWARDNSERVGFAIGLFSHVAGSVGNHLAARVGFGVFGRGLVGALFNAFSQSAVHLAIQELSGNHRRENEIYADLSQSLLDASLCSLGSFGMESLEHRGFGQGALVARLTWASLKFLLDVNTEFWSGKVGLAKFAFLGERGWLHLGSFRANVIGLIANGSGEGLGDLSNHYGTSHLTHSMDILTQQIPEISYTDILMSQGFLAMGLAGVGSTGVRVPRARPPQNLKLSELVNTVVAATRADSIRGKNVNLKNRIANLQSNEGFRALQRDLAENNIPLDNINLQKYIYQTDDKNRGTIEAICNGFDAESKRVKVNVENEKLEIEDEGKGMSLWEIYTSLLVPNLTSKEKIGKLIGRFGVGFYTLLQYLQNEGDTIELRTTQGGKTHLVTISLKNKDYEISVNEMGASKRNGTKVTVKSKSVEKLAIEQEMEDYLRYFNPNLDIVLNGRKWNTSSLIPLQGGGSFQSPLPRGERARERVASEDYSVFQNPQGTPGRIVIMVGDVIVEQTESHGSIGLTTSTAGPETILKLPLITEMDQTRRGAAHSEQLYEFIQQLLESPYCNIAMINALAPWAALMEQRSPKQSYLKLLRQKLQEHFLAQTNLTFYPRTSKFNENNLPSPLRGRGKAAGFSGEGAHSWTHPLLWNELYSNRLKKPKGVGIRFKDNSGSRQGAACFIKNLKEDFIVDEESSLLLVNDKFSGENQELFWGMMELIPEEKGFEVTVSDTYQNIIEGTKASTVNLHSSEETLKKLPWGIWDGIGLNPVLARSLEDYEFHKSFGVGSKTYYFVSLRAMPDLYAIVDQWGMHQTDFEFKAYDCFHQKESGLFITVRTKTNFVKVYFVSKKNGDLQCIYHAKERVVIAESSGNNTYLQCGIKNDFEKLLKFDGLKMSEVELGNLDPSYLKIVDQVIVSHENEQVTGYETKDEQLIEAFNFSNLRTVNRVLKMKDGSIFLTGVSAKDWVIEIKVNKKIIYHPIKIDNEYTISEPFLFEHTSTLAHESTLYCEYAGNLFIFQNGHFELVLGNVSSCKIYNNKIFVLSKIKKNIFHVYEIAQGKKPQFLMEIRSNEDIIFIENVQQNRLVIEVNVGKIPLYALNEKGEWVSLDSPKKNWSFNLEGFWTEEISRQSPFWNPGKAIFDASNRLVATGKLLDASYLLQSIEQTRENCNIPLFALEQIGHSEKLQVRWLQLKKMGFDPHHYVLPIAKMSDESWEAFMEDLNRDASLLSILNDLIHPAVQAYYLSRRNRSAEHYRKAFLIIQKYYVNYKSSHEKMDPRFHGDDDGKFLSKIEEFLEEKNFEFDALKSALEIGVQNELVVSLEAFLRGDYEARDKTIISSVKGKAYKLEDCVTHLKSTPVKNRSLDFSEIPEGGYQCKFDVRSLVAATQHLHVKQPYAWIREIFQNSLDACNRSRSDSPPLPGPPPPGGREIDIQAYIHNNEAIVAFYDPVGMEEEVLNLIQPGATSKILGQDLGGFGVGFKAILSGANWVRVKTAKKNSKKISYLDFRVTRDAQGNLEKIFLTSKQASNVDFYGTWVETGRHAKNANLELASIEAQVKTFGRYIDPKTQLLFNKVLVNAETIPVLTDIEDDKIGKVELMDALDFQILLGDLPLCAMDKDLWEAIPEGIREFFKRRGCCIKLDPTKLLPIESRDRLQNHEEVMARLKQILPALMIKAFLTRVLDPRNPEDLHHLPQKYFMETYDLANENLFDPQVMEDAELINSGNIGGIKNYEKYFRNSEGEKNLADRRLMQLVSLVKFIPFSTSPENPAAFPHPTLGEGEKISVKEVYDIVTEARDGNEIQKQNLERLKEAKVLPLSLQQRIAISENAHQAANDNERLLEKNITKLDAAFDLGVGKLKKNQEYPLEKIKNEDIQNYLEALQQMIAVFYTQGPVTVGVHTHTKWKSGAGLASFARHGTRGKDYHLYRSFGETFKKDVETWKGIFQEEYLPKKKRRVLEFLISQLQTLSHEGAHILKEGKKTDHDDSATHDKMFYQLQIQLIFESWMRMMEIAKRVAA